MGSGPSGPLRSVGLEKFRVLSSLGSRSTI